MNTFISGTDRQLEQTTNRKPSCR